MVGLYSENAGKLSTAGVGMARGLRCENVWALEVQGAAKSFFCHHFADHKNIKW